MKYSASDMLDILFCNADMAIKAISCNHHYEDGLPALIKDDQNHVMCIKCGRLYSPFNYNIIREYTSLSDDKQDEVVNRANTLINILHRRPSCNAQIQDNRGLIL